MRKYHVFVLIITFVSVVSVLKAQPQTVHGFNAGSTTEQGVSVVFGQAFDSEISGGGFSVSEGVSQSQLVTVTIEDSTCMNEPYTEHGYNITNLALGTDIYDSTYEKNVAEISGYDRLTTLQLTVFPVYEVTTSEIFRGDLPVIDGSRLKEGVDYQVVEGENTIHYLTIYGCDSVVNLYAMLCPDNVADGDQNLYPTAVVAGHCWTQKNLRARHYADGVTEIGGSMIYRTAMFPDEVRHDTTYGRLYTWPSAVNADADGHVVMVDGYVQGVCPDGWHIPTETEMAALKALSAEEIRTPELWYAPNNNTNSTGFTALPAGRYNAALLRFEGLGTQTDWWVAVPTVSDDVETCQSASLQLQYYCNTPLDGHPAANDGLSVRCVKNS